MDIQLKWYSTVMVLFYQPGHQIKAFPFQYPHSIRKDAVGKGVYAGPSYQGFAVRYKMALDRKHNNRQKTMAKRIYPIEYRYHLAHHKAQQVNDASMGI